MLKAKMCKIALAHTKFATTTSSPAMVRVKIQRAIHLIEDETGLDADNITPSDKAVSDVETVEGLHLASTELDTRLRCAHDSLVSFSQGDDSSLEDALYHLYIAFLFAS